MYQGYEMYFLKKQVHYQFRNLTVLYKTKFSYRIKNIHYQDMYQLNKALNGINPDLILNNSTVFINGKTIRFTSKKSPDAEIEFKDGLRYRLEITIQGLKKNIDGEVSPIWKINEAHLCI
jgi:hypothetical protein